MVAQQKNLEGYVGFANLPNQVYRKSVKRGFEFTLMVVGQIGSNSLQITVQGNEEYFADVPEEKKSKNYHISVLRYNNSFMVL
ncbi:hypothetical protein KIL84_010820 [Mauremys mutica]|uniref:Uncharacterized protein n=1 Tax=Mauremys mutica TaxID=74926 RepID=A0A9D4B0E6_9SAUR|nr:hypothetical protein KIL84_010820 [Mauremys mutica]